jgi:D-glucuronyl C5-epimerase C-terminus/Putative peptidoglycan binding domain
VARVEEPFLVFADDAIGWWDDPGPEPEPQRPPRRRRPPPRTLAGDLARLRRRLGAESQGPLLLGAAAGLVLLMILAYVVLGRDGGPAATTPEADPPPVTAPTPAAAGAVPVAPSDPTLRSGDTGVAVRDLQQALVALGYSQAVADGAFGAGTAAAVAAFQGENELLSDGIAGSSTTARLREVVAAQARESANTALAGLGAAESAGRLGPEPAAQYRQALDDALAAIEKLPPGRGASIELVLGDVAAQADVYDRSRALALFGMLAANVAHFATNPVPVPPKDMTGEDGIVYRWFGAHGFQFHPLANFAALNGHAKKERREETERLATAMLARGVRDGRTLTWEYYFPFAGPGRWTSALAQAAGAQALARSGTLLEDDDLLAAAGATYREIARDLSQSLGGGTWVKEYSYSDMAVLNAQLQSIVSLAEYARTTEDAEAREYVASLSTAARTLLPEFDTGCWSRYSLGGSPASDSYHRYHVTLLQLLSDKVEPQHAVWAETHARWKSYLTSGC